MTSRTPTTAWLRRQSAATAGLNDASALKVFVYGHYVQEEALYSIAGHRLPETEGIISTESEQILLFYNWLATKKACHLLLRTHTLMRFILMRFIANGDYTPPVTPPYCLR